eukprot:2354310-Pyramimonas_sp.AAC.1
MSRCPSVLDMARCKGYVPSRMNAHRRVVTDTNIGQALLHQDFRGVDTKGTLHATIPVGPRDATAKL